MVVTSSGSTARRISRSRPLHPVVALCDRPSVARRARLYFGIRSRCVEIPDDANDLLRLCTTTVARMGLAGPGDRIAIVAAFGEQKQTNGVVVLTLE